MTTPQSTDDLLDGIDAYVQDLLELTEAVGDLLRPAIASMWGSTATDDPGLLQQEPSTWSTRAKVFLGVKDRPITLATTGFRLVGAGPGIVIGPAAVSFVPPVLAAEEDSFTVIVQIPAGTNGIYEGTITAASDPSTPITDPVMPAW
jgi:hypothetical protein